MNKIAHLVCLLTVVVILSSCATRKDTVYLQDMYEMQEYPVAQKYEAVIQRDDKISIKVSAKNPELALAFNIPGAGGGYSVSADGTIANTSGTPDKDAGYIVDVNGDIDFPIIGKLHVESLTRNQLTDLIKKRLIEGEYLKDPIVIVDFLNFKFSVLGEVGSVGTYETKGNRVTLLEAIAMAGDLTDNARVDRVAVIREYGNKRRIMFNDLRSKDIFLSPSFYLQQNDIVYVEPNSNKAKQETQRAYSMWSMFLSSAVTLTTLIFYFTKK
ncbi:MAG: polysaccharide biosynthesis/export family protein [Phocaeicola sp.]|uniref:polysaccharide biosynthesis/export family protein n=1 Tax=Phocaeicola sp. TaxID=2773926 RepID=UPI003F9EC961